MADLTDKSRYEISRYRDHPSIESVQERTAAIERRNRTIAAREATRAQIQECLDELEHFGCFEVTGKKRIDSMAVLMKERNWKGTVTIAGSEDSVHLLQQYAQQKGVPVDEPRS